MLTFKFPITVNDIYEVRSYEFSSTKSFQNMVLFERIAGIAVVAFVVYLFRDTIRTTPGLIAFLALCLVWIIGFPWFFKFRLKAHAKREMQEAGEKARDGITRITFGENVIEQESPGGIRRRIAYNRVVWVEDAKKYVMIYDNVNPTPIIIVSKQVFETKEEREEFVSDLRDRCQIKVENKKVMLKNGPRLKVKKR